MARDYYYLVSGLKEYQIDTDTKGFDAVALREEIAGDLSGKDVVALRELYMFYDISNILVLWSLKDSVNTLGNLSKSELKDEMEQSSGLMPGYIEDVIAAYKNKIKEDKYAEIDESIDTLLPIEKNLWNRFYSKCAVSDNQFIRDWYNFDLELRNICAAYTARMAEKDIARELVGDSDMLVSLERSSAVDFGLKNEIDYIDKLVQILDNKNMIEKERKLDLLRWEKADEFTEFDYFNVNRVLAYCVKLNIIHRWLSLDKVIGLEMFRKLIEELSSKTILERAVEEVENTIQK